MVDPPTYRAEPDPEFADRLERVLLQRLTAMPDRLRSRRGVAQSDAPVRTDTDPDDQEGDIIMLDTQDRPTAPVTPGRRSPGRWLLVAAAVAVVAVVGTLLVAAGGDDEDPVDTVSTLHDRGCTAAAQDVIDVIGHAGRLPGPRAGALLHRPRR